MSESQRQLRAHSSSIFELQRVLQVHSASGTGSTGSLTSAPKGVRGDGDDGSYDYVLEMITDVRSEHGVKIDDINDKVYCRWSLKPKTYFSVQYKPFVGYPFGSEETYPLIIINNIMSTLNRITD